MSRPDNERDEYAPFSCIGLSVGTLIVLTMLPSWFGLLGDWHWTLDLFSHFRWQYLIVSVLAVAWTAWRRQGNVFVFAGATLLLNGFLIGRLAWHPEITREKLAGDFKLTVLSLNVLTSNPEKQQVLDHVLNSDADVVFLMEVNDAWMAALLALKTKYPHHIGHPRPDNFGVALFSRIPWKREETLWLGDSLVPTLEIELTHGGRELVIVGTHPVPPVGRDYATRRDGQLRALAEHVATLKPSVLVVGDFNATPWSAGTRIITANGRLGYRSLSPPWTPTWRAGSIFAIPIDHALCTEPLVISERKVGPDVGSDHRSVRVTMGWENPK
jgi:endonuclease/exonuclease/phosphatase (EEP) superfamily protein YafD